MSLKEDVLNRQEYVDQLIQIINCLSEKKSSFCFAIDGRWGSGKTYILEMLEEKIGKLQSEETAGGKYFVFNYNCWKYDYYEEPAVAIVAAMIDKMDKEEVLFGENIDAFLKSSWGEAKKIVYQIAGEFSKNKIGVNLVELVQNINDITEENEEAENKFDEMFSFKQTLDSTRKKLDELAQRKSILFIVDELDRCLPQYSIKVLERLHHLFDGISNITVLLSVDSRQLNHSIKKIYGDEIEIGKYLKKFIDFTLTLNNGEINETFENKYREYFNSFANIESTQDIKFFSELFYYALDGIDIRTQEKLLAKAKLIHEIICDKEKFNPALLCFELMWTVFSFRTNSDDLSWVTDINGAIYIGIEEAIGKKTIEFLKKTEKSVANTRVGILPTGFDILRLEDTLSGNTYWIFSSLYSPIKGNTCNRYLNERADDFKSEVEKAKKFRALAKIMN